jgi:hypothetical protein
MRRLLLIASLLFCVNAFAQTKTTTSVKGILIDTVAKQQLRSATVNVLDKDSVLVSYSIAKEDGNFTVFNLREGSYYLYISFSGYETMYKPFSINKDLNEVNVGSIYLQLRAKDLGNVTVTQAPVVIKGDTTEFNAGSFRTKPNATAEDLFKKLPGVQVEKDGTVKAQGEAVKRVLVDGKRFFGDDPKMATKNLPTDIIDKVQVYDAQSDQSAFSGFDDGNREKTINIITKKDKRKGYFGRASVGGGTDGRYAANVNLNRFNGNQQIALISQANNTNSQNFSVQDILGVMNLGGGGGGARGGGMVTTNRMVVTGGGSSGNLLAGGSSGITRTLAGGLNYNDVWSKNTSVSGSFFYNDINNTNVQDKFRETFTKDTSLYSFTNSDLNNKNTNQRYNFEIDQRLDSFNSLLFRPSGSFQRSNNYTRTLTKSTKANFYDLNDVDQTNTSQNEGYNLSNSLLWRHKFGKKGRTLSVTLNNSMNNNESEGRNLAFSNSFNSNFNKYSKDTVDQLTNTIRETNTYGGNFSYTEPMGKKALLELSYNYNHSLSTSDQKTQRMNKNSGKYDPYAPLTNEFENTNISHRSSINYRRQINAQWNYTVGMGLQRAFLESVNKTKNTDISQWFTNYTPTVAIQYTKNRTKNLRFNYRGNTTAPNVNQLQPIQDITNQLNIKNGNPDLRQSFNHNFNLFYSRFDVITFRNIFASVNGSFTQDKIGSAYTINTGSTPMTVDGIVLIPGAQYSKPVNLDGAYNVNGFLTYGIRINKIQGNLNFTSNLSHNREVNLVNSIKSFTKNYSFGETIGFNMNIKEKLDLNLSSTSTFSMVRYSMQTAGQNTNYFTQMFSIEPTYTTKDDFIFGVDFDYTKFTGQGEGFNQSIPLLNASISKLLFKNKAGELKLSAFDLLNQNKSITTNADVTYFESIRTTVLKRYFMVSFTYNLRRFGGKQMPSMFNMRQQGGMRMSGGGGRMN